MHYKSLVIAHKAFYRYELRAWHYDQYLENKNWDSWETPDLPQKEVRKLFDFIKSWDYHFRGDPSLFKKIYGETYPTIKRLKPRRIQDVNLQDSGIKQEISYVFDRVADCCLIDRFESTDASKILHTVLPDLFIMWDRNIRKHLVGGEMRYSGGIYASEFLPRMQKDVNEVLETCIQDKKLNRVQGIRFIRNVCGGKTLAKLSDEYNYMLYTMSENFLKYIEENSAKLPPRQYGILRKKLGKIIEMESISPKTTARMEDLERTNHQKEYGKFIDLINKLKTKNKIDAEQWREYNRRWREFPERRNLLIERLRHMLGEG